MNNINNNDKDDNTITTTMREYEKIDFSKRSTVQRLFAESILLNNNDY